MISEPDNRTTEKCEGLIDSWKLRKLASIAQGYAECDPRLNGREILFESAEAMRKAANTIEALSAKRTCECDGTFSWEWTGPTTFYEHELSCGHTITSVDNEPPNYCEECGAKVVDKWAATNAVSSPIVAR